MRARDLESRIRSGIETGLRRTVAGFVLSAMVIAAASCAPEAERRGSPGVAAGPPDMDAVIALIEAHNRRLELLTRFWAGGVIEFRWVDDEGKEHFEPQVNARLWLDLPRRTALRAAKMDEVLFWLGSDPEHYWMFDLMGEETVLYVGRHAERPDDARNPLMVRPLSLVDLLGLAPIPVPEADGVSAEASGWFSFDADRDACVITAQGAGGPIRVFLDRGTGLPMRVETLSREGEVLLFSELGRYASVPIRGVARAARPKIPTLIDLADPAETISVKLALDRPSGDIENQPWENIFALSRLLQAMRPDRIEGDVAP
jgi:hypothetical protein